MSDQSPWHIVSLVLYFSPKHFQSTRLLLAQMENIEVHTDDGNAKLVAILEGPSTQFLNDKMAIIQDMPGCLSSQVAFHQEDSIDTDEAQKYQTDKTPTKTLIDTISPKKGHYYEA